MLAFPRRSEHPSGRSQPHPMPSGRPVEREGARGGSDRGEQINITDRIKKNRFNGRCGHKDHSKLLRLDPILRLKKRNSRTSVGQKKIQKLGRRWDVKKLSTFIRRRRPLTFFCLFHVEPFLSFSPGVDFSDASFAFHDPFLDHEA